MQPCEFTFIRKGSLNIFKCRKCNLDTAVTTTSTPAQPTGRVSRITLPRWCKRNELPLCDAATASVKVGWCLYPYSAVFYGRFKGKGYLRCDLSETSFMKQYFVADFDNMRKSVWWWEPNKLLGDSVKELCSKTGLLG